MNIYKNKLYIKELNNKIGKHIAIRIYYSRNNKNNNNQSIHNMGNGYLLGIVYKYKKILYTADKV